MGNAGMPFYDSVEIDEMLHPMLVETRRLDPDSEGAGMFRGAPGILTEYRPRDCDFELGFVSDGTVNPALGTRGGQAARPARQFLRAENGEITPLATSEQLVVRGDQLVVSYSNGGGGYGDPAMRDPQRVVRDVKEGWISRARAAEVYRVALRDDLSVDDVATRRLRGPSGDARG
jgi:N-methylhydantoinase B